MNKPDITPGPWYIPKGHCVIVERACPETGWGCTIAKTDAGSIPDIEQAANARAIAAVPDLLAALELALHAKFDNFMESKRAAHSALVKAGYTF